MLRSGGEGMEVLRRLWSGEMPLEEAFWTYAVIGGIAVNLVANVAFFILLAFDYLVTAFSIGYGFATAYNLFVTVGVWRSAGRPEVAPRRATVYRTITVIGMTLVSLV